MITFPILVVIPENAYFINDVRQTVLNKDALILPTGVVTARARVLPT